MTLRGAPVVAEVVRSGFVESVHHGVAAVTDPSGAVVASLGDPETVVLARSAFKPLQAVAAQRAGAGLRDQFLALACASHAGEPFHVESVRTMLASVGLGPDALLNTPSYPSAEDARATWIRSGLGPEPLAQNCSGKHAGMLAACIASGWGTTDYLAEDHPLQLLIRDVVQELTGTRIRVTTVDGCGAPTHGFALSGLARAFGRLASTGDLVEREVADAMRAHPLYVGGTGRPDTNLMTSSPGVLAKIGAEAVFAVGLPDGHGVAVKVADGSDRAAPVVAAGLLRGLGVAAPACDQLADVPVLGHGLKVGVVRAVTAE